jgi:hypothetical protein
MQSREVILTASGVVHVGLRNDMVLRQCSCIGRTLVSIC